MMSSMGLSSSFSHVRPTPLDFDNIEIHDSSSLLRLYHSLAKQMRCDPSEYVESYISKYLKVTSISLISKLATSREVSSFVAILPFFENLKHLDISSCPISKESSLSFAGAFDRWSRPQLESLTLRNCNLNNNALAILIPAICKHPTLRSRIISLDLSLNEITAPALGNFAAAFLHDSSSSGVDTHDSEHTSAVPALQRLILDLNPLGLSTGRILGAIIAAPGSRIEFVSVGQCQLGDADLVALGEALRRAPRSTQIDTMMLNENDFTDEGVISFADTLSVDKCPLLSTVGLVSCHFGSAGYAALLKLTLRSNLSRILVARNPAIGLENASLVKSALGDILQAQKTAFHRCISLLEEGKDPSDYKILVPRLNEIDLTECNISSAYLSEIEPVFRTSAISTLIPVSSAFSEVSLTSEGLKTLEMGDLKQLQSSSVGVDLSAGSGVQSDLHFDDDGQNGKNMTRLYAARFFEGSLLGSLVLDRNPLGDAGGLRALSIFRNCGSLVSLSLAGTFIGAGTVGSLSSNIPIRSDLRVLDLSYNGLEGEVLTRLCRVVRHSCSLQTLVLAGNKLDDTAATLIGASLPGHKSLRILDLRSNEIGFVGAVALAKGMEQCASLRVLLVKNNANIGEEGRRFIVSAISRMWELGAKHSQEEITVDIAEGAKELVRPVRLPKMPPLDPNAKNHEPSSKNSQGTTLGASTGGGGMIHSVPAAPMRDPSAKDALDGASPQRPLIRSRSMDLPPSKFRRPQSARVIRTSSMVRDTSSNPSTTIRSPVDSSTLLLPPHGGPNRTLDPSSEPVPLPVSKSTRRDSIASELGSRSTSRKVLRETGRLEHHPRFNPPSGSVLETSIRSNMIDTRTRIDKLAAEEHTIPPTECVETVYVHPAAPALALDELVSQDSHGAIEAPNLDELALEASGELEAVDPSPKPADTGAHVPMRIISEPAPAMREPSAKPPSLSRPPSVVEQ
eukprot:gnl/Dysnectes_brevis/5717_a8390_444.p1 GENE.gnl/Dysnectes_brevis/5717_a8390_444~~gnl/Dysnectes_brevis/5717_a8390_444.p1  ORF type:complete len:964 (+),score=171.38 gnl/Dysnectes_brevis/5717_a8390_444:57-2948(+)